MRFERLFLIVVVTYFIVRILIDLFIWIRCRMSYDKSKSIFSSYLGYIIAISGRVRVGKTTMMFGLGHIAQELIMAQIEAKKTVLRDVAIHIDFGQLDNDISSFYAKDEKDYMKICEALFEKYSVFLQKDYYDFLSRKSVESLFRDYVEATVRSLDHQFVMANVRVYSRIAENYNVMYESSMLDLKDNYLTDGNYYLNRYLVILDDEKSLQDKLSTDWQRKAAEDSGSKELLRLFGQVFKETSFYITTNQNTGRWVKEERELATAFIHIVSNQIRGDFPFIQKILDYIIGFMDYMMKISAVLHRKSKRDQYLNRYNVWKRLKYGVMQSSKWIFSRSFISYESRIYRNADDLGKNNTSTSNYYDEYNIVLPIRNCFGVGDTHFYSFLHELMMEKSTYSFHDLEEMTREMNRSEQEDLGLEILAKRNKKNNDEF